MSRIVVFTRLDEKIALAKMAAREARTLQQQAYWIIRRELEKAGFLPTLDDENPKPENKEDKHG